MNSFANAVVNQEARTANGMKAQKSTSSACVDLFFKIGAMRGKNVIPDFTAAFVENRDLALRIALWARDVRGGAGERQLFREILTYLENSCSEDAARIAALAPALGRWDDLLVFKTAGLKQKAFSWISHALNTGNGLCAKWMPRKGETAVELRKFMGLSPKAYRKLLVGLTKVVETQMCAKDWDNINFSQVPSLASARYRNAFYRNTEAYKGYVEALTTGDDPAVKVNTGAVYPYDVIKSVLNRFELTETETKFVDAQWAAMPNYMGNAKVFPMIDVSGSMMCHVGGSASLSCMQVAISLGLYCADKNTGAFKDLFLTFSEHPSIEKVSGSITQKLAQIRDADWGMNTNVSAAMDKILQTAKNGNVPQDEMPEMLVIFSDMQFDRCAKFDDSAMESFKRKFEQSGYAMPKIVFWNLNAQDNVPVKSTESGVALVSGFSPAIMKALLSGNMEEFTPENIMLKTVMSERYDF
jgi:hypothetical protein